MPPIYDKFQKEMLEAAGGKTDIQTAIDEGRFFVGGKAISLGGLASTDRAVLRLANPVGSGKLITIVMVSLYSSVTQQVRYNENGTITAVGTVTPQNWNRALASPPASIATLEHGTTAVSGGADWPNESRVFNTSPLPLNFTQTPLPIPPGKSFLIRGTVGDAQTFTANAYWVETTI